MIYLLPQKVLLKLGLQQIDPSGQILILLHVLDKFFEPRKLSIYILRRSLKHV